MSRYRVLLPEQHKEIVYGFDHVFYYFFQEVDLTEFNEDSDEDAPIVKDYDYYMPRPNENYFGHVQLLECLEPYKKYIPKEHLSLIAGDLPF